MSFRCAECEIAQTLGTKPIMVAIGIKPKSYLRRFAVIKGEEKIIDNGGAGWEITGEKMICKKCFSKIEKKGI